MCPALNRSNHNGRQTPCNLLIDAIIHPCQCGVTALHMGLLLPFSCQPMLRMLFIALQASPCASSAALPSLASLSWRTQASAAPDLACKACTAPVQLQQQWLCQQHVPLLVQLLLLMQLLKSWVECPNRSWACSEWSVQQNHYHSIMESWCVQEDSCKRHPQS